MSEQIIIHEPNDDLLCLWLAERDAAILALEKLCDDLGIPTDWSSEMELGEIIEHRILPDIHRRLEGIFHEQG